MIDLQEWASIAECIRKGDALAEEELAAVFRERVYVMALARARSRAAADDVANETLLAVLLALRKGQLRQPESVPAFVHATARNLINNHFRQQSRQREDPILEDMAYVPGDGLEDDDRRRLVRQALEKLDAKDRGILVLTLAEGLKPGEIAGRLRLTSDVVRARKSRALKKVIESVRKVVAKTGRAATNSRGQS